MGLLEDLLGKRGHHSWKNHGRHDSHHQYGRHHNHQHPPGRHDHHLPQSTHGMLLAYVPALRQWLSNKTVIGVLLLLGVVLVVAAVAAVILMAPIVLKMLGSIGGQGVQALMTTASTLL
jgi:hypothetical protein